MIQTITDVLWSYVIIGVLTVLGLLFTVASRFVQIRHFTRMFRVLRGAFHHEKGRVSSYQALALGVAGRVGAGNIAGVAVAIILGGPGAIFWMWMFGLMGMATSFFECSLAQLYKRYEPDGTYRGGPAYYIETGLNARWLAMVFSILLLIVFGFAFNALQSYTIAISFENTFGIPTHVTGIALATLLGFIIFGGIRRIATFAEFLVPIMAIGYVLIAVVVIGMNIREVPGVFSLIIRSAFGLEPAIGGIAAALLLGARRGLLSNEAGLGSGPNIAAVAHVKHPANQGIVQAFSVFIDTIVICSCTAFIILLSTTYQPGSELGGVALTQIALASHLGEAGRVFVTLALLLFATTSITYNYYLGENSINFFSEGNRVAFNAFRVLVLALLLWGSVQDLGAIFAFADLTMGLLALVNLTALVLLFKTGLRVMRDFDDQVRDGVHQPVFRAERFADLPLDPRVWNDDSVPSAEVE